MPEIVTFLESSGRNVKLLIASPTTWTKVAINAALAMGDGMLEIH